MLANSIKLLSRQILLLLAIISIGTPAFGDSKYTEIRREDSGVTVEAGRGKASKATARVRKLHNAEKNVPRITAGVSVLAGEMDPFVCWVGKLYICEDREPAKPAKAKTPTPSKGQVEDVVRRLVARLDVPDPVPQIGPDPSTNEWNMAIVGLPLWLWTHETSTLHSQVNGNGITITMHAQRTHTTFTMGDNTTVHCTRMTPYPKKTTKPALRSPTCGHTYTWPSLPKGNYRITATSHWTVNWAALGHSGTIPLQTTAQRELPVGELHSLTIR